MLGQSSFTETLQTIPWFLELKPYQLERLASVVSYRTIAAGEELFLEGERDQVVYVLLEGQIDIEIYVPGHEPVCIFTAEPLDIIGWSAMTPVVRQRTATARAVAPCRLLAFEGEQLHHLCEQDHDIGYIIMRRLSNVVASRLLTTRLHLYDLLVQVE